ncbi:MAG: exodeoxyribonuclease III [Patescibacteria group bacterium]|nr:exodeoxyribonuclease III [Patescibacteria group bacterium]
MKIISWNVNGIRAVYKKGDLLEFIKSEKPDILCLQEIKAAEEQIPNELKNLAGYFCYFNPAKKPGYSGVAVFTKEKPQKVEKEIGFDRFDSEGRALKLVYTGFTLYNFYIPNGGRGKKDLNYKLAFYDYLFDYLRKQKNKKIILAGDFNVAHTELDLARPKENQDSIMFTKEERAKISQLLKAGFIDTFRQFHQDNGYYTWWLYFANARERNIGWRIDYVFATENLKSKIKNGFILPEITGSDHCPAGIALE